MSDRLELWDGNDLATEAAIAAGCRFYAGYPITPSSEIAERMARRLPQIGGVFIQMEDEIASIGAVIGASLTGVKAMTATSGPGFSLKQENIGYACIAEVPVVIVNVMRGGPSTGLPTAPSQSDIMQARWGTHGDHEVIAIAPALMDEVYSETIRAFNLSEQFRVPVIVLMDEILAHLHEAVKLPEPDSLTIVNRKKPTVSPVKYLPFDDSEDDVPPMANFFEGFRYHVTGLSHSKSGFPSTEVEVVDVMQKRRQRKITRHLPEILKNHEYLLADAEIAVVAIGSVARAAIDAVDQARRQGIKAGLFRPITLWPFPEERMLAIAKQVRTIIVPEMNLGQLVLEVQRTAEGNAKIVAIQQAGGQLIRPREILAKLQEVG